MVIKKYIVFTGIFLIYVFFFNSLVFSQENSSSFWRFTDYVSPQQLKNGIYKTIGYAQQIQIRIDGKNYFIGLVGIPEDNAKINISYGGYNTSRSPIQRIFSLGEEKSFDLNNNSIYDISITYISYNNHYVINLSLIGLDENNTKNRYLNGNLSNSSNSDSSFNNTGLRNNNSNSSNYSNNKNSSDQYNTNKSNNPKGKEVKDLKNELNTVMTIFDSFYNNQLIYIIIFIIGIFLFIAIFTYLRKINGENKEDSKDKIAPELPEYKG